ncbi:AraC family transcriptional regulator [Microbulbifer magnicolonia]|uniref:AraC family transcriptional regulator n=1 Tax=Microbulbifer magnicolonia TaxID=3109744 RepID=UPI002B411744|nr:AraC family transcriptional regulator [Microbulbifer sp. GG15]
MTQLIETASLTGFYELVTRLNGNPEALLGRFNIAPEKVKELEGALPFGTTIKLIEEAARELDCPDFGLRLATCQELKVFGPLAAMALNAPTVGGALRASINCLQFFTRGLQMALEKDSADNHSRLWFEPVRGLPALRQNQELVLGVAHLALKMLCGEDFRPQAVLLKSAEPLHDRYQEFFGAPVYFAQDRDALVLSANHLERKIAQNDPQLHQFLNNYIGDALRGEPMELHHQVERLIHRLMPIQRCSLQEVANRLGLHKRTLQRRLSEQTIIFEDLLDSIRRERTESFLAEAEMPMTQIAALLGYREQSSFNRACRRWFGTTPLKVRRQLLQAAAVEQSQPSEAEAEAEALV